MKVFKCVLLPIFVLAIYFFTAGYIDTFWKYQAFYAFSCLTFSGLMGISGTILFLVPFVVYTLFKTYDGVFFGQILIGFLQH